MNTKKILLIILIFGSVLIAEGQNCSFYYPMKEGAELSYTNFNKKDKETGKSVQKITKLSNTGNTTNAEVVIQAFDKKDKLITESTMSLKCEGNNFLVSMERFLTPESMEAYQEMEVEIESDDLVFPKSINVGDELPDGKIEMVVKNNSIPIMDMAVSVSNRTVEAKEKITTPAGTFDCIKISYDVTTQMVITIRTKATEWISKDVGMVKSVSYNKNGSLMASTVLTSLKK